MRGLRRGRRGLYRPNQVLPGACFNSCCHSAYAVGANPIGAPGCPLFARSTASIDKNLIAFIDRHAASLSMAVSETVWTFDKVRS